MYESLHYNSKIILSIQTNAIFFLKNYIYLQKGSKNHMTSLNRSANLEYVCLQQSIRNLFNLLLLNVLLRTKKYQSKRFIHRLYFVLLILISKSLFFLL